MYTNEFSTDEKTESSPVNVSFPSKNLVELLQLRALQQPHQVAFTFLVDQEEIVITYAELDLRAKAIAAFLQAHTSLGDRALLLYPSGLKHIAAFFGCLYAGVIAIPAYPPKQNRKMSRLESIVNDSKAKVVLTETSLLNNIRRRFAQYLESESLSCLATDIVVSELASDWKKPNIDGHTTAFLQYTSGSTGTPKGVIVSHENLLYNSEYIKTAFQLTSKSVSVSWLPIFHDMGLVDGILQPLYTGFHGILMSPDSFVSNPLLWLQAISRYRATHCGGPNFGYDLCLDKVRSDLRDTLDLSSWLTAYSGGEPVRAETLKRFSDFFAPCGFKPQFFYPCFGMAESTLMISGGSPADKPVYLTVRASKLEENCIVTADENTQDIRQFVGCGGTWLDTKVVIADPDTLKQTPFNQVGEILVKGTSIARGYWNKPEETEKTFKAYLTDTGEGPFLRTGDLGFINNGELFITGRIKDLIIIRGRNYYPQDIETTVEQSDLSLRLNCGAVFTIDLDGAESLVIVQEVKREYLRKIDVTELSKRIRRAVFEEYELQVHEVVLIKTASIPKTSSGKIQRSACKQKYLNGELKILLGKTEANVPQQNKLSTGPKSSSSNEENPEKILEYWMKQWIVSQAELSIPPEKIASDSQFIDYGLDSVRAIEFASEIEKLLDVRLAEGTIFVYPTIRELSAHILHRLGDRVDKLFLMAKEQDAARDTEIDTLEDSSAAKQFGSLQDVLPEYYHFDLLPEYLDFKEKFSIYESGELDYPYFRAKQKSTKSTTLIDDREYIDFSSFDYLRLSSDPNVIKAAQLAVERYGTSAGASRIVSGETPLHQELEDTIARWLGTEDAMVFGHGHATNVYAISSIVGPNDLIVHDKYMHNSALMGSKLSGATTVSFSHNNLQALEEILEQNRLHYQRVLLLVEGVYSMDGDILADLPKLIEIKERYKSWLFIDEAHSIGVLGETGRGVGEHFGIDPSRVDIWMGTISKALGSSGGYIAGCKSLIAYLKHSSPGFLFTVGASPANVAAGLAAIQKLQSDNQLVSKLQDRAQLFSELAQQKGLNIGTSKGSGVVPIIVGDSDRATRLADAAYKKGINVFAIGYPAVDFDKARLRFFVSSLHTEEQIKFTTETIAELLEKL
ncbi:MAG: aminotransferase class I/II-fold pyridoxal phosphate-dependent enzyme [Okeania sp. SIO3H1]|uniref:aminotransferase class I/II-fold pyridoxal phosphate-dependent enzyme n=1 Tax=Okeania sp. SIO1I7 TaxID=2607772 RepID=UPI0013CC1A38|nr:aminotransferase class I/II-fold pyridoxal phosphate-dependent enzyme [Okeania sp. SIO1I7]NEN92720.1 aminotransferase class I/II-fold pyridoxal phosphate-dependent enzyme [Okeania sp. SIO3H1]NET28992.1 aminotransferase class I/II-fold pyridoxal phosphate-dependent enzyme [Okeania sp. SIO1I7]